jgi:surface antigen
VMHLVKEKDTVGSLAEKYKTDAEKIIEFNDLSGTGDIIINEVLIIPNGKLPSVSIVQIPTVSVGSSTNNFYGQSHAFPWGQCTWWVAQKRAIPAWGHAKDWLNNAIRSGYAVCKGSYCIPQVGAVISLSGNRYYGHVGYVEEVKGDKVVFSEMNYIGLGRMNYRTLRVGSPSIKGYIY